MKLAPAGLAFMALAVFAVQSFANTLPDSCGDHRTVMEVATHKHGPPPSGPEAGKARIVFIESADKNALPVTTRFALDGSWVGANRGNSYFDVSVEPGEHHICADWQLNHRFIKDKQAFDVFTAEAGATYFFRAIVEWEPSVTMIETGQPDGKMDLRLSKINNDEGRYLIQNSRFSVVTLKR